MKLIWFCMVLLLAGFVKAADCKLTITREACPGMEAEVLKPYEGKKVTEEKKEYTDEADCVAWAQKSARILRKKTLSVKKVTATFDGQVLPKTFEDQRECK